MAKLPSLEEAKELIKLLKTDVFFFLFTFAFILPNVTSNQLVQDKLCFNEYNLTEEVCLNLEASGPEFELFKDKILETSTWVKNLQIIITTAPGILLCLYLGYWIDSYPGHLRYLLAMAPFAIMVNMSVVIYQSFNFNIGPYSILYGNIFPALTGGLIVVMTGTYTYVTRKTPAKYRAVRFAILELFFFCAIPMGTAIGGKILTAKPWFPGQHRNYVGVFLTGAIAALISCIWVLVFINDSETVDPSKTSEEASGSDKMDNVDLSDDDSDRESGKENGNSVPTESSEVKRKDKTSKEIFLDIINTRNVVSMMKTCCKKRDNQGRARLWHLVLMMTIVLICYMGEPAIGFQFCQKVYHWNAEHYSYISSTFTLIPSIGTTISPALFVHKFHWHDTTLALVGCLSLLASTIIKGSLLTPTGFYIASIAGIFSGLTGIAVRSLISRIISFDEIGQVFSLLSCIESCGPMVSSIFYTSIFNSTIETFPGIVFQAASLLLFYPLIVTLWIDSTRSKWDLKEKSGNKSNPESRNVSGTQETFKAVSYSNKKSDDDGEKHVRIEVNNNADRSIGSRKSSDLERPQTELTDF